MGILLLILFQKKKKFFSIKLSTSEKYPSHLHYFNLFNGSKIEAKTLRGISKSLPSNLVYLLFKRSNIVKILSLICV